MSISIGPALQPSHFISELKTRRRESVLGEMARRAEALGMASEPDVLASTLLLRERLASTAVGHGVAVPNARTLLVHGPVLLVGLSRRGIDWAAADGELVRHVLLALSPPEMSASSHVAFVGRVSGALRSARARQRLLEGGCSDELAALLQEVAV